MVLLAELRFFGFKWHILLPEKFYANRSMLIEKRVPLLRQLFSQRVSQVELLQLELARFQGRLDLFHELKISFLGIRIVRVTSHRDVALGRFFVQGSA